MLKSIKAYLFIVYAKIFGRRSLRRFNHLLIDLGLRGIGVLNFKTQALSGEEHLKKFLQQNYQLECILDVGANVGDYTSLFKNSCPSIHCIEPNVEYNSTLVERFKKHPNIHIHNFGLSDTIGEGILYDKKMVGASSHASIYQDVIKEIHQSEVKEMSVNFNTIDNFIEAHGIEKITLLKIDTEGGELDILKGAETSLSKRKIDVIQFEFNEMNVISRAFMKDFITLLPDFNLYRLLPNGFLPVGYPLGGAVRNEIFAFQNIVAFRKEIDTL